MSKVKTGQKWTIMDPSRAQIEHNQFRPFFNRPERIVASTCSRSKSIFPWPPSCPTRSPFSIFLRIVFSETRKKAAASLMVRYFWRDKAKWSGVVEAGCSPGGCLAGVRRGRVRTLCSGWSSSGLEESPPDTSSLHTAARLSDSTKYLFPMRNGFRPRWVRTVQPSRLQPKARLTAAIG